jgi:RNA polymerase sigma factor (sigma-70 family)
VTEPPDPAWSEVWKLYLENREVFAAVISRLRGSGVAIDEETAQDSIHEFIVDRARDAVRTFRPELGELKGWLYVVFRRFVVGKFQTQVRRNRLLSQFASEVAVDTADNGHSASRDLASLGHAILQLSHEHRSAVNAFLHAPDPSVRAVARSLGISRWKASTLLNSALSQLSAQLRGDDADPFEHGEAAVTKTQPP